jgi:hypothetical protein
MMISLGRLNVRRVRALIAPSFFGLLVCGLAVAAILSPSKLAFFDERQYLEIAQSLLDGRGYSQEGVPTAYRPPVWPLVLAGLLAAGVPVLALNIASVLFLSGAALLARGVVIKICSSSAAGWLSAYAMILYPLNAITSLTIYPQAFETLLFMLAVSLGLRFGDGGALWAILLFAVCLVGLVLSVPTTLFAVAVLAVWGVHRFRVHWPKYVALSCAAFVLLGGLWVLRNEAVLHRFIPISTATGVNLLLGNNENAGPSSGVSADIDRFVHEAEQRRLTEVEQNDFYVAEARAWVIENPGRAASLYAGKVGNYFVPYNEPATAAGVAARVAYWVSIVAFVPLCVLTLARLALYGRHRLQCPEVLILSIFVANAFFMALTFTRARFRQPFDSVLIIESSVAIAILLAAKARTRGVRQE